MPTRTDNINMETHTHTHTHPDALTMGVGSREGHHTKHGEMDGNGVDNRTRHMEKETSVGGESGDR